MTPQEPVEAFALDPRVLRRQGDVAVEGAEHGLQVAPAHLVARDVQRRGERHLRERHAPGRGHLVFASAKYLSNKQLKEHGIDFAPLPFALYREG